MRRRGEMPPLSVSAASGVLARFLQLACAPGGKVDLRIETDPGDMALSIEVVAARSFLVSGKGLEGLKYLFQGITERIGAENERRRVMVLEQRLSDMTKEIKECTDGRG